MSSVPRAKVWWNLWSVSKHKSLLSGANGGTLQTPWQVNTVEHRGKQLTERDHPELWEHGGVPCNVRELGKHALLRLLAGSSRQVPVDTETELSLRARLVSATP